MFKNAQNLTINGGTFISVQGNQLNNDTELGLHSLGASVSLGAIHDSSERYPPPSCHAETRLEVRRLIMEWIEDPNPTSFVLWLYGSAGVGKTAIMQSIAEQLALCNGRLGASFFFSAGKPDRNQGQFLFPTIAYQFAFNIPELRTHIDNTMRSNPALHAKSIDIQLRGLIVESFRKLAGFPYPTPTVIVDGLDECKDHETQRLIITLIYEALIIHQLPLRFLIASRPEAHIRETFDTTHLYAVTHRIPLDQSFQASRDIEKYLRDGFDAIYNKNIQVMAKVVKPWPEQGVIDLLVHKASGQFIYAATVLKFVGAEYFRPTSQLAIVLQPAPPLGTPFADLDHLYRQVLSSYHDPDTLVRVLGTIFTLRGCQPPEVIEDILGMEEGDLSLILRGLHSVVNFPASQVDTYQGDGKSDEERGLRLFHASFHDYLVDCARSGPYFVDEEKHRLEVTSLAFGLVAKRISRPWSSDIQHPTRPRTWGYLRGNLAFHFWQCSKEDRHRFLDTLTMDTKDPRDQHPASRLELDALHCALSFVEQIICAQRKLDKRRMFDYGTIKNPDLAERLEKTKCPEEADRTLDEKIVILFKVYHSIIDNCYDSVLSESSELDDFIRAVPGFFVILYPMAVPDMADLLDVEISSLENHLERNRSFLYTVQSGLVLNWHVFDYLSNKQRSGVRYHDRRPHNIAICMRGISLTFDYHWSHFEQCKETTRRHLNFNFADYLCGMDILPSDTADHPLWTFVEYLEGVVFYHSGLYVANFSALRHIWFYTSKILCWVQKQQKLIKQMETSLHTDFQRKLDNIVNRICGQVLHLEATPCGPVVTLCPPFLAAIKHEIIRDSRNREKLDPIPFTIRTISTVDCAQDGVKRLSYDVLLLEDINSCLKQYLTNPSRCQGMYIREDLFHTQLAEMWLDECLDSTGDSGKGPIEMSIRLMAGNNCKPHFMRANGTDKIFNRLRELESWSFIGFSRPHTNSFRDVVAWLEGLERPPLDIYLRYQMMLLKAEEDDAKRAAGKNEENTICSNPFAAIQDQECEESAATAPDPALLTDLFWKFGLEVIKNGYLRVVVLFNYCYLLLFLALLTSIACTVFHAVDNAFSSRVPLPGPECQPKLESAEQDYNLAVGRELHRVVSRDFDVE